MVRVGLIVVLAAVASACTADDGPTALPVRSEVFAPDGSTTSIEAVSDGPVVLNFFAAWCPPCVAEMPALQTASAEFAGRVEFVGVSRDIDDSAWLGLIDRTGVTFPTFRQPSDALFLAAESPTMPTTVFLDADGTVAHVHAGPLREDTIRSLVDEHLGTG